MSEMRAKSESVRPEMLKLGRMLRAKTQRELADETGIDQALISKYENGRTVPETDLNVIAQVLQLPSTFFRKDIPQFAPYGANMLMFRRRQATSGKIQEQVFAELSRLSANVQMLLNSVEVVSIGEIPLIEPQSESVEEAEQIADATRLKLRIPMGPIQSMIRVMESVKVVVIQRQIPAAVDALVGGMPDYPPVILLSDSILGGRQRFTLAHELGHLVMHNMLRFSSDVLEKQAFRYGSAFLMPAQDIKSSLHSLTMERLIALSAEWRVSVQAIVRRAFDLETIEKRQYQYWNEQLSKNGFRTVEPIHIPTEKPTLMKLLIDVHMNELGYSTAELAESMLMEEWEFERLYLGKSGLRLVPKVKKPVLRPFADGS